MLDLFNKYIRINPRHWYRPSWVNNLNDPISNASRPSVPIPGNRCHSIARFAALIISAYFLNFSSVHSQNAAGREVLFRFRAEQNIRRVEVVGSFNNWRDSLDVLSRSPGSETWTLTKWLPYGRYEYRFKIDGKRLVKDPLNPQFGGSHSNSLLLVNSPGSPGYRFVSPLPGSEIDKLPLKIKIKAWGGKKRKINAGRSRLLLDSRPLKFKYHKKDSLITVEVPKISDGEHHLWLRVENNKRQSTSPDSLIFRVNLNNEIPVADAGNSRIVPLNTPISLNGGLSFDPDNSDLKSFRWKFLNNQESVSTGLSDSPFPAVTFSDTGRYVFSLAVNDGKLWSRPDTSELWVLPFPKDTAVFVLRIADIRKDISKINKVAVVGEFNQWNKQRNPLHKNSGADIWKIRLPLRSGEYEYKFVINDTLWLSDPANPRKISDGWNGFNSIVTVRNKLKGPPNGEWVFDREFLRFRNDSLPENSKIYWFGDYTNPDSAFRGHLGKIRINFRKLKEGAYFLYRIFLQGGKVADRKTFLLKNKGHGELEVMDFNRAPGWARDAIAYQIYPRRFGPDSTRSGNFQDIIDRLDYLQQLGVNSILLMPVMDGPTDHGYGPVNYFQVEKDYGSLQEFSRLIRAVHQRGMRLIFDFVANHSSDQHPYFRSAWQNPASAFRNWYLWRGTRQYDYYNDWDALPNLNYDNPNVRHFILKVAKFWAKRGVDGFRADAAWGVPHAFWKDLRRTVKAINPDFVLLDEVLPRDVRFHDEEFDMSYDTDFYGNLLDVFRGRKPLSGLIYGMKKTRRNYPPGIIDFRYIENQDLPRFITTFGEGPLRIASALLLTTPGMPLIYYGQELGLREMRPQMQWNTTGNAWLSWYQRLISLRKEFGSLRRGDIRFIENSNPDSVMSFVRTLGKEKITVFLNFTNRSVKIRFDDPKQRPELCLFGYPRRIVGRLKLPVQLEPYGVQIWINRGLIH